MNTKKKIIKTGACVVIILFVICLCVWMFFLNTNAYPKQTHISFSSIRSGDIDPEMLTDNIMKAIGYPKAAPIVTKEDIFFVVLYNKPKLEADMKLHSLASSFRIRVPEKDDMRVLSYEIRVSQNENLVIIYRDEINDEQPNEYSHPQSGFNLTDVFSAIRDFPAESYRNLTKYGEESADLYSIRLNDDLLFGENFSYNINGSAQNDKIEDGIPFLISHMKWGKVRDDSLDDDDPQRYYSFGGEGRVNLYYFSES